MSSYADYRGKPKKKKAPGRAPGLQWNGRAFVPKKTPRAQAPRRPVTPTAPPSAGGMIATGQAQASAPLSGGMGGYDVNSDPAVAAAQGLAAKIRTQAQASALAKRKQAAIEYGDPTGVEGVDEATSKAARENPFSVLKNLEHTYTTGTRDLEEGLNSANLFYSGYRGQQLGEAARGYQDSRYQAGTRFKGLLTDVNDQLAAALLNADYMEQSAIMGSSGGSYGGDGGGGDDSGSSASYNPNSSVGYNIAAALGLRPSLAPGRSGVNLGTPTFKPVTTKPKVIRYGGGGGTSRVM